jgi:hypothetical protein
MPGKFFPGLKFAFPCILVDCLKRPLWGYTKRLGGMYLDRKQGISLGFNAAVKVMG